MTPVTSLDLTRQLADLSLDGAPARLIASGPAAARAVDAGADRRAPRCSPPSSSGWPSGAWT